MAVNISGLIRLLIGLNLFYFFRRADPNIVIILMREPKNSCDLITIASLYTKDNFDVEGSGDDYHYGNYDDQRGGQSGGVPTGSNNDNSYPTNARDPYDNDPYKSNDDIDIIDDVTTTTTLAPTTQMTTTTAKVNV